VTLQFVDSESATAARYLSLNHNVKCSVPSSTVGDSLARVQNSCVSFKGRVHCFSMQVVVNEYFLLNLEKKFSVGPFCRFREKRTFNSEK